MTWTIGRATPADASRLADLHAASFDDGWALEFWTEAVTDPDTDVWLAAATGGAMGLLTIRSVLDEAEILTLCTSPEQRRRGVAQTLLVHGIDAVRERGVSTLFLEVAAANQTARRLYASQGFQEVGRRPGYYANGDTALVLRLTFSCP